MPFDERAAILLKAADLLAGPWRQRLNAATMLGQSKTAYQAEIDAACELIDFWRFNVHYAKQILADQPIANSPGVWNRTDHRPLEGFVYAITPFNFTAIAGNLPTAPALMGNTVIWKPSPTQQLAASLTDGAARGGRACRRASSTCCPATASRSPRSRWPTPTWPASTSPAPRRPSSTCGARSAPTSRVPHLPAASSARPAARTSSSPTQSADPDVLRAALIRGAFEFQGQKCSAASRAYVARSVWKKMSDAVPRRGRGAHRWATSPTSRNFMGAVIDDRAFAKHKAAIARAKRSTQADRRSPAARSTTRSATSCGPTVVRVRRPDRPDVLHRVLRPDPGRPRLRRRRLREGRARRWSRSRRTPSPARSSPRTGAAIAWAREELRFAAGNFYINDKPTGAVVGQQPFGGARASGTNDKAGAAAEPAALDVARARSRRPSSPPTDYRYPHMG